MDYQGGPYGYPPYDENQDAGGQDPYAPRSYRDDPAYGSSASPYGQSPAYGQGDGGYASGGAGYPPSERGYTGRTPVSGYGDGSDGYAPRSALRYGAEGEGYVPRSATGRTTLPRSEDGYTPRGATGRTTLPRSEDGYAPRGATGRTTLPRGEDGYARTGADRYAADERDDYDRAPRAPKSKKKRSKFGKFMHALGLYLAQMPAKTLVIFGGTIAMILVAVILLAVLLPNSNRTARSDAEDGQLALMDKTPTPSLAPTDTPAPTEAVTPTPTPATLTEPISAAGTVSDLMPDIQKRLVELGYMTEPEGGYTNKYGPTTKMAIRIFQLKNFTDSNSWDGIIGNATYSLLMSSDAKAYYLTRGDGDARTSVLTKLVQDVTDLQNRLITLGYLTGSATGLYGNSTVVAVQTFQQYHGLLADGKAGQETLKLIYSADAMDATTGKANDKSKLSPTPSTSPSAGTATTPSVSP